MRGRGKAPAGAGSNRQANIFSIFCEMAKNQWGVHPIGQAAAAAHFRLLGHMKSTPIDHQTIRGLKI
jgi:hypothetical protein